MIIESSSSLSVSRSAVLREDGAQHWYVAKLYMKCYFEKIGTLREIVWDR